jgi:hypothetical protein
MRKFFRKIRFKRKLKSLIKTFDEQEVTVTSETWLKRAKRGLEYFDNDPELRSLVAQILHKWRNRMPYKPQFDEAKELYDEYFQMENHIPSFDDLKEGDYVVQFRGEAPVKGDRFAEYWVNGSGFRNEGTYRLAEKNEKYDYFPFELDNGDGLSRDFFTSYRYATKEEIKKYKVNLKKFKSLEKEIDAAQKVVQALYQEKSKVFS